MSAQASTSDGSSRPAPTTQTEPADKEQPVQAAPSHPPIHIVPYGPPAKAPQAGKLLGESSNSGKVQYYGGPVISNVHIVEVLWGSFVDAPSTTGLDQFFTDVTQSNYFALLAEYGTVGLSGLGGAAGSNQTIGPGHFDMKVTISPSLCPGAATLPPACTINDSQIQTEILNQLNAGKLPTPVQDTQGNFNSIYMVYFPPGVTIVLAPGVNSCQAKGFCAYHSNVDLNLQPKLPYGVFPDFGPTSGCSATARGCGAGTSQQNLSSATSHEMSEAVTDVDVGSFNGTVPAPPLAWVDQISGNEIGDFCNQDQAQITVNSNTYTVQQVFSNMQQACVSAPPHFDVNSLTNNVVPGVTFAVTVSAASSISDQALNAYNNTVHFTSSDGAAVLPADYTYLPNVDHGTHTFNVTFNTTGNQTLTVNDTVVTAMVGSATVDTEHNPDLTAASSHSGNFKQSDMGDTYTITATNIGDLATNGSAVTLTVGSGGTLPFGLTATALSGSGWSCVLASLSCTTTVTVAAHASYPAITLTVNVANNALPLLTLFGQVSGGGELNTTNDSFSDPTVIVQFPDLQIAKRHLGSFAQGQIGATYTIEVTNVGFAPTSGLVTVTDTLPTGLTATAISGPGWSCSTPPTLTCTRSDSVNPSTDYPTLTLTVNVDAAAPMPSVTNTASISGGGEVNLANDTTTDLTLITAAASDMVVASTHAGNFTQGQIGAMYTLTASNIGPLPTSGTVTVTDSLPAFFSLTAMSGTGWLCNTSSVPPGCTRSDVLPGDTTGTPSSYPPITVTVNVAPNAPTGVAVPFVLVAGGGELNTVNDESEDLTLVNGVPDFAMFSFHLNGFPTGGTGTYTLEVDNFGQGASSGNVTVVDNLPAGFTAVSMSGPGWNCVVSTVTCTRSDSLGVNLRYPLISLTVNIAANLPEGIVTNMATVTGVGDVNSNNNTGSDQTEVLVPLSFVGARSAGTVKAGTPANFSVLVSAGALGTINLACSNLPAASTCVFASSPTTVQVPLLLNEFFTVNTTAAPASTVASTKQRPAQPLSPFFAGLIGLAAMVVVWRRPKAGRTRLALLAGSLVVMLVLVVPGCGGGGHGGLTTTGNGGNNPPTFTPPGTYTITITATNGNLQATTSVDLTVQ